MKSVKISGVHHAMLSELAKKYRMTIEDLIKEIIEETYNNKKK